MKAFVCLFLSFSLIISINGQSWPFTNCLNGTSLFQVSSVTVPAAPAKGAPLNVTVCGEMTAQENIEYLTYIVFLDGVKFEHGPYTLYTTVNANTSWCYTYYATIPSIAASGNYTLQLSPIDGTSNPVSCTQLLFGIY